MPICRFCKSSDKKLIKAHIITRSIFKLVKKNENYSVYFEARKDGVRTEFKQVGSTTRTSSAKTASVASPIGIPMEER